MKEVCFFTIYDSKFKGIATGLKNSIHRFYPDIKLIEYDLPRPNNIFDLKALEDLHQVKGLELLKKYKRVIAIDTDHIMCAPCPDLFDDFDFGVVQNNVDMGDENKQYKESLNAGLTVFTNIEAWREWNRLYLKDEWSELKEQTSLCELYEGDKFKAKLLEFPDRVYGISSMDFRSEESGSYGEMRLVGDDIYIRNKRVCLFHAAGFFWKDKDKGEYNFQYMKEDVANRLRELMK
jgi:hypothetical protein